MESAINGSWAPLGIAVKIYRFNKNKGLQEKLQEEKLFSNFLQDFFFWWKEKKKISKKIGYFLFIAISK